MHFRNDHVKYPMITPSLFLITFLLDVYFVLIIEYINFKFLSSCLSCCGMKEKRKRNTFRCCRNGTHYYPFTINYVDDIENDYKQEEDDNEKEEEEDHVSNDIENEITSLLESSKKNNENIKTIAVGDNYNDLDMLKISDYPCLVFNDRFRLDQIYIDNLISTNKPSPEGWADVIKMAMEKISENE